MAMVVTDLDGTLLDTQARLGSANRRALERLGEGGSLRVIATGRSLYSAESVLAADFPIDYLVFSSGAGILDWRSRELLAAHQMRAEHVQGALALLLAKGLAFMVHLGVPDNHHFYYHAGAGHGVDPAAGDNPDFHRRCQRYADFAQPMDGRGFDGLRISQLLVIEAPGSESHYDALVAELEHLNVVLTTSPLDHRSRWIEIFPAGASKSQAADWLRRRHGLDKGAVVAVGNDYNDRDLLDWAHHAYVVANAPAALKTRYAVVASNDDQGFAEAVAMCGFL
jgi:hydroxymethylpyrimidine pyrophosphatase-like HAD family hydrolase